MPYIHSLIDWLIDSFIHSFSPTAKELDDVISKLHVLKNKTNDAISSEVEKLDQCQKRVEYLKVFLVLF